MADTALFGSHPGHLRTAVPGGVQVCTAEYLDLFRTAGFDVRVCPISTTSSLLSRLAIRAGVDVYAHYDAAAAARTAAAAAPAAGVIALNQMDLAPLAAHLRALMPAATIVALSHGNSSGDYPQEALAGNPDRVRRAIVSWKLRALEARERLFFTHDLDLVLCLSGEEERIDRALGARDVMVVPRTFRPEPLPWRPEPWRVGILGTIDHYPNRAGIEAFATAAAALPGHDVEMRLVGAGAAHGRALEARFPFIHYLGPLPDDALRAEASTWSLFAHPLFWLARGASTKIATAVNWGLPIVTTPAGLRGYRWSDGEILTAADPGALAALAVGLLRDQGALTAARASVLRVGRSGPAMSGLAAELRAAVTTVRARRAV